jgi:hypothetical protein
MRESGEYAVHTVIGPWCEQRTLQSCAGCAAFPFSSYICQVAHRQTIFFLWRPCLPDPKDDMILELAFAAGCDAIVTHNPRDFQGADRLGVRVHIPSEFLRILEESR